MDNKFNSGIAFVFEGDTEKVFYLAILNHFVKKHTGAELEKNTDEKTGEIFYVLSSANKKTLIKMNVVGTVSQITNSDKWFSNRCYKCYNGIKWSVFLCYDMDSYDADITKFQEGDWAELKKALKKGRQVDVYDMAANADIEDIMLLDADSVFSYLDLKPCEIPSGRKGKAKMKKIFRMKGSGYAYHEGDRAQELINSLDLDKIIAKAPLPLDILERECFE